MLWKQSYPEGEAEQCNVALRSMPRKALPTCPPKLTCWNYLTRPDSLWLSRPSDTRNPLDRMQELQNEKLMLYDGSRIGIECVLLNKQVF
jgi:hypothetical protein